jgi:hypothetical protein
VEALLTTLETLYSWQWISPPNDDFNSIDISSQDLSHFKKQHAIAWAESIVHQTESAVETAILLFYWRVADFSLVNFKRLLVIGRKGDFGVPKQVGDIISYPIVYYLQPVVLFAAYARSTYFAVLRPHLHSLNAHAINCNMSHNACCYLPAYLPRLPISCVRQRSRTIPNASSRCREASPGPHISG